MTDFTKELQDRLELANTIWKIKVIPSSSHTEIIDIMDNGTIKIRVGAAPENDRANKELVKFLEKNFGIVAEIISGNKAKLKIVKLYRKC